ncbi:MAG TPA: hypothetical protein VEW25_03890 [Allosphingosinicella sp.]|nr:hypothetical protein [Allosphingosinicella sp.]
MRASILVLALAGCDAVGRDCSLAARLEAHAPERAAFRQALGPLVRYIPCPSTVPEVLIPEEERIEAAKRRLRGRIALSELGADLAEVQRAVQEASQTMSVDCLGVRWVGEEHVRDARAAFAGEEQALRALEARFQALARRIADC